MARQPKMLWGKINPYYMSESQRASDAPLDGSVQGAKNDFKFKIDDFVMQEKEDIVDYDNDGEDDTDKIISENVVDNTAPTTEKTKRYCYESSSWMAHNCGVPNVMMATIHGDFLYGTVEDDSFPIFYIISEDNISMRLNIENREIIVVGYESFMDLLSEHNMDAIEARYSPYAVFTSEKTREKIYRFSLEEEEIQHIIKNEIETQLNSDEFNSKLIKRLNLSYKSAVRREYTPVVLDLH